MFSLGIAVLMLLGGAGFFAASFSKETVDAYRDRLSNVAKRAIAAGLVVLAFATAGGGAAVFMGPTVGVPTVSGKIAGEPVERGIHFLWNPVAKMEKFPATAEKIDLTPGDDVIEARALTGQKLQLNVSVQIKIAKDDVVQVVTDQRNYERLVANVVKPVSAAAVQDAIGTLTPAVAVRGGEKLTELLANEIRQDLKARGVTLVDVTVRSITGDESTQAVIEAQNKALAEIDLQKSLKAAAEIAGETKLVEAQADRNAAAARVQGLSQLALCQQWAQDVLEKGYVPAPGTANPCGASTGGVLVNSTAPAPAPAK